MATVYIVNKYSSGSTPRHEITVVVVAVGQQRVWYCRSAALCLEMRVSPEIDAEIKRLKAELENEEKMK